jgi:peptidoglycan hydrolase-like protein with peptidoglycan-binding domain
MEKISALLRVSCGVVLASVVCAAVGAAPATKPKAKSTQASGTSVVRKASVNTTTKTGSKSTSNSKTSASRKRITSKKKDSRSRGQKAPTVDRVTEIQEALAKKGAYPNDPSGKWDAGTVDAMKKFQQANGLNPSGKLNALTLQKLGLGSDVAGRAAPRPEQAPTKQ